MVITSRTDFESLADVIVKDLDGVQFWLNVHQRYSVQDARRMNDIEARLRRLEKVPFVKLWLRLTNG